MKHIGDTCVHEPKDLRELAKILSILSNPIRLRMIAMLSEKPMYISEIARQLNIPYPIAHLHLSALERAGFIKGEYIMYTGKRAYVKKYYRVIPFKITITPDKIRKLARGEEL